MAKQENEFLYHLARFAVTVVLLGLIILWVRSGEPTPSLNNRLWSDWVIATARSRGG